MDTKDWIIVALKTLVYACTLILAALGVSAMVTSCSVSRSVDSQGRGHLYIDYRDTTTIDHAGSIYFPRLKK